MKDGKTISCNRIAVTEAGSGATAKHHFAIEDKCHNVGIQEMLIKLYIQDLWDQNLRKDEICDAIQKVSYKDKKFTKMMNEKTVNIGSH